ncbi:MAG: flagellar basal body P-ring protein FlgI [Spirochaetes bacterium]|nr:flagellar basal body P-ring protein FlgI [Spirochaetota bacterium]
MKNFAIILLSALTLLPSLSVSAEVAVKLKDISFIDGLKENQVYGYGLVVGLQGTGDTKKSPLTNSSLKNLLKNLGMEGDEVTSANTAAVLITGRLAPFVRIGDRIDVTVSSIGDAKSIEGGILIQSPLRGGDGRIYAVAQGTLAVSRSRNDRRAVRTVGQIANGAVVEREISPEIVFHNKEKDENYIYLVLKEWDYTVGDGIIKAVAGKYPESNPVMASGGRIQVRLLKNVSIPEFISTIENIEINPVYRAKVVVNERDGTIVTGGEVKLSAAMVSREGLTVEVRETGKKVSASELKESATVKDLVDSLNAVGATTTDIISILKALKVSGALHADLIVR